jgi:hypothetical protein
MASTIGESGKTISLASGATASGFAALDWQTGDIKTSTFTAVAGKGYFVNTTGGAITVNLPAGSAGAQIGLQDYAGTWDSNNCTVAANGSEKIQGSTDDAIFSRDREALQIIYVDSTQGWVITSVADQGGTQPQYVTASGGTETTSGDFKIHTFTGDGTFTVSSVGNTAGSTTVDYLVIAGGGAGGGTPCGGNQRSGGGGAGGYRESFPNPATGGLSVSAQAYPITIGAGGTVSTIVGSSGANTIFSSITSTGGGKGAHQEGPSPGAAASGGSGGGGSSSNTSGGSGNTPPVSPSQGNNGGVGTGYHGKGGGGGGAAEAGNTDGDGDGGDGTDSSISGSPVTRGGGGAGSANPPSQPTPSAGTGGGGAGGGGAGTAGTANTGGGGGAGYGSPNVGGGAGGSGVVIIRYKYQN